MDSASLHNDIPLAEQLRPQNLDEFVGQEHLCAADRPLRKLIDSDRFSSVILWGPPGCGKTTLAHLIGHAVKRELVQMSAVEHGVKDIRQQINRSVIRTNHGEAALLVFMDEIHRLNKAQQDILLPALEKGQIKFIGATTENPSFEVNPAILSRSLVFGLQRLENSALIRLLNQALQKLDSSGVAHAELSQEAIDLLAQAADGDGRAALNLLQAALAATAPDERLDADRLRELSGSILRKFDKSGDQHYDIISAFIKSIRASDPDAAIYYLARMIDGGEDPMFIARRLVIAASEDIGNANPTALLLATSCMEAVHRTGYPECRIMLAQATTYLAASPKSNRSYLAIDAALDDVRKLGSLPVPLHLRNAPTRLMKEFGYGKGYTYAHDNPRKAAATCNLPNALRHRRYYEPTDIGTERQLKQNLQHLRSYADSEGGKNP